MQVRRDYDPKSAQTAGTQPPGQNQFLISPITGEKIAAEKMQEHLRFGTCASILITTYVDRIISFTVSSFLPPALLDPRWVEDTKKQIDGKKTKEEVFAEGVQISSNLKRLAERRTDIFGMEETMIGQKIGEEEVPKASPVQWDGHAARWVWPFCNDIHGTHCEKVTKNTPGELNKEYKSYCDSHNALKLSMGMYQDFNRARWIWGSHQPHPSHPRIRV